MPPKARRSTQAVEIRIIDATLTTQLLRGREVQVVYGKVMPDFFGEEFIAIPDYQRMAMLDGDKHQELVDAFAPDGMGIPNDPYILVDADFEVVSHGAGEILIRAMLFHLADGHQRFAAARERLERGQSTHPMLIKFMLGLSLEEQLSVFYQINRNHTPVSTHVHLRNIHNISAAVELRKMAANTEGFPRLKLDQLRKGGEEITVRMLYEVAVLLHGYRPSTPEDILDALEDLTGHIGVPQIVENVRTFFTTLKVCFLRTEKGEVHKLSGYIYRRDLLGGLAVLFANFEDFWDKRKSVKLRVLATDVKKLKGVSHKSVENALGASSALRAVYEVLRYHTNGQREKNPLTPRIQPWRRTEPVFVITTGDEETDDE
ncbi:MAG TPA: hypothetical protein VJM32_00010 [Candidatus Saccharimonadales bacterium]|nr:hypothetical protein [Candidatus Saccharimonadales bacterium]